MLKNNISKKGFLILRLLVSCGILIYLIIILDWKRFAYTLSHVRPEYIWLAPILLLFGLYFAAIRWSLLLSYLGINLSKKTSFIYYLIGTFYSILLPGVIGGDVVRIGVCSTKQKKSIGLITTSALLERIFGLLLVFILGTLAIFFLPDNLFKQLGADLIITLPLLSGMILVILIIAWFVIRLMSLEWLKSKTKKVPILGVVINFIGQLGNIPMKGIFMVAIFSALFQSSDIVASYCLAKAILIDLPLVVFFVIIPIVYLSTILPISLGGLGIREGVLTLLLTRIGIQSSDAVTLSFLLYLNRVFIGLIGGAIQILWNLPKKNIN